MNTTKYFAVVVMAMFCFSSSVLGQEKTHTVKRKETLYKLSKMYNVSVADLKAWNGLSSNTIKIGQKLKVGQADPTPTGDLSAYDVALLGLDRGKMTVDEAAMKLSLLNDLQREKATSTQAGETAKMDGGTYRGEALDQDFPERFQYYQVKPGDDLFSIADTYETSVDELRYWNSIEGVQPGDVIIVRRWRDMPVVSTSTARTGGVTRSQAPSQAKISPFYIQEPGPSITNPAYTPLNAFSFRDVQGGEVIYSKNMGRPDTDVTPMMPGPSSMGTTRGGGPLLPANDAPLVVLPGTGSGPTSVAREVGAYGTFSIPGYNHFRFYAAHKILPVGSKVKVDLPNNPGHVEVTVVDQLPANSPFIIGLSPSAVKLLQASGVSSQVSIMY